MGQIILKRDGSFYRVQCDPVDALPPTFARPSTYFNHRLASDTADLLGQATGFPVIDETERKGRGDG